MSDPILKIELHQTELNELHDFLSELALLLQFQLDHPDPETDDEELEEQKMQMTREDLEELNRIRSKLASQDPEC